MDKRFKELIWLTKEEAEIISNYFRITYLWNPNVKDIFDEKDIKEIYDVVDELTSCIVAVNLSKRIYDQIKFITNFDVESIFFKDFCNDFIFTKIKEKTREYKIIYIDQI